MELNKEQEIRFSLTIKVDCCAPFVIIPKSKKLDEIEDLVRKNLKKRVKHLLIGEIASSKRFGLCTTSGIFLRALGERTIENKRKATRKNAFSIKISDDIDIEKDCKVIANQTLLYKRHK